MHPSIGSDGPGIYVPVPDMTTTIAIHTVPRGGPRRSWALAGTCISPERPGRQRLLDGRGCNLSNGRVDGVLRRVLHRKAR
jgi:hypothetical protein